MRRKYCHVVGEREHAVAQRVIRRSSELFLELRTEQIDARDLTDEERATREEVLWIVAPAEIGDEIRDVLRRVSRRRDALHGDLANLDDLAVGM